MTNFLIFNHHSLPFSDRYKAEQSIPDFIKIISSARTQVRMTAILLDDSVDSSWFGVELAPGYFWREWFGKYKNDNNFKEMIRSFKSMLTQTPLFKAEDVGGSLELFDVRETKTDRHYSALRATLWYESLLCSFPSQSPWNANPLSVIVESCDSFGTMHEENKELTNVFNMAIWEVIKVSLIQDRDRNVRKGKELWAQCKKEYPYLQFCGKCPSQLQNWSSGLVVLNQAKECFYQLNLYAEKMTKRQVKGYSHQQLRGQGLLHEVSGESSSVRNDHKKKEQRMFYTPDGRKEFFEKHAKLANGFRLHFFPKPQNGIIYIGYIGPHLKL